jgi:hypothetical protein
MAAWDIPVKLRKLVRDVEDLFKQHSKTTSALDAVDLRLHALEDRMTRLEAGQGQLVTEAKAAAGAAATMVAGAVISDIVTRVTRIEMRAEHAERSALPPPAG